MVRSFKDVFVKFAETTTAHAPPKVVSHKNTLSKVFWFLMFFTGIAVFLYFSVGLVNSYREFATTTDIKLRFAILEFPAVTICNQNQFRMNRVPQELKALMDDFLQSKRGDMFGGEDKFKSFMKGPGPEMELGLEDDEPESGSAGLGTAPAASGTSYSTGTGTGTPAATGSVESTGTGPAAAGSSDSQANDQGATGTPASEQTTQQAVSNVADVIPPEELLNEGSNEEAQPTTAAGNNGTQATIVNNAPATGNNPNTTSKTPDSSTTQAAGGNPNPSLVKRRRRKRAVATLSDEELKVMDNMRGFYVSLDNEEEIANMTWFDNVGETSADLNIFLNMSSYLAQHYSMQELMKMGHSIEEMLQECTFLGKICGPEDFYMFYDNKYGNCYTFNSGLDGSSTKISNPGTSSGLAMTLFINQNEYVPVLTPEAGIRVLLHRQGQVPLMEEDGFDVSPGAKTGIAVRYVEITRKGHPYGTCESLRLKNNTLYPGNYTQKGCIKECIQTLVVKECGCAHPSYRKPENVSICTPDQYACVDEQEYFILEGGACSDECPVPCWESQFQYTLSASKWPADGYKGYFLESMLERGADFTRLLKDDPDSSLEKNFLRLNIYYDNLNYYKYEERETMKIEDLIGALGGHLGLWIGMSLVSFFEIFEMIISVFKYCCCRKSGKTASLTSLNQHSEEVFKTPVKAFKSNSIVSENF